MKSALTFTEEETLWRRGKHHVAGVDEVGRGPLAGPVVAAAVVLPVDERPPWLQQVRDSKQLSPKKRMILAEHIHAEAVAVGIGVIAPEEIDAWGIVPATKLAMCTAIEALEVPVDFLLIDAVTLPEANLPQKSIIKGDTLSLSIASASIVAKVHRDRLMANYESIYPDYGFAQHKGYPTTMHLEALQRMGCCPIHRRSFRPVQKAVSIQ